MLNNLSRNQKTMLLAVLFLLIAYYRWHLLYLVITIFE